MLNTTERSITRTTISFSLFTAIITFYCWRSYCWKKKRLVGEKNRFHFILSFHVYSNRIYNSLNTCKPRNDSTNRGSRVLHLVLVRRSSAPKFSPRLGLILSINLDRVIFINVIYTKKTKTKQKQENKNVAFFFRVNVKCIKL